MYLASDPKIPVPVTIGTKLDYAQTESVIASINQHYLNENHQIRHNSPRIVTCILQNITSYI